MNAKQAKQIPITRLMSQWGYTPVKERPQAVWYISPFRKEHTASFKVNPLMNAWYDFGAGEGGSILDLVVKVKECSVEEALESLRTFSFEPLFTKSHSKEKSIPTILQEKRIQHPGLTKYLQQRKIPFSIAEKYLVEVHYQVGGKRYFGLGMKNNLGGYEVRSKYFKGCIGRKSFTFIDGQSNTCLIFEGGLDFLSYLALCQVQETITDVWILNSLSLINPIVKLLKEKSYDQIRLFLDNDAAGDKATQYFFQNLPQVKDSRLLYLHHKDINDYLIHHKTDVIWF